MAFSSDRELARFEKWMTSVETELNKVVSHEIACEVLGREDSMIEDFYDRQVKPIDAAKIFEILSKYQ